MPAVAKSPKAVTKVTKEKEKKPKASKTPAVRSHPPYFQMIKEAILALRERTGSSFYAIAKHVEENHKGELPASFKKVLSIQLRNGANNGKLVKVKASFKLSDEAKKADKAKRVTEKVKEKKPVKKTAASTVAKKRKAPSATTVAKPKKKVEAKAKAPKKAIVAKKVKKVAKSPVKAKKPKSIKSPGAKKARVAKA